MKPVIKYLYNGEYQYATVKDIGDVEQLKTVVKTDLVGAINSILGNIPADYQAVLDGLEAQIDTVAAAGLNQQQITDMQAAIDSATSAIATSLNNTISNMKAQYDQQFIDVVADYEGKVATINDSLTGINDNLAAKETALTALGSRLSSAELNVTTVTQEVDDINGVLATKVNTTDFNLLETTVSDHGTAIEQNSSNIALKASQSDLDLATGRISDAEAKIEINAQGITSAVKKDEMLKELDALDIYAPNILRNTRDWEDWESTNPAKAYVALTTYQHTKIQEQLGSGGYLEEIIESLEIGKTYTASVWAKSTSPSVQAVLKLDDVSHAMSNVNGDTYLSSEWQRVSVSFVAADTTALIGFSTTGAVDGVITHFAGGKVESGAENTGWQPHINDATDKITSVQSVVNQQAGQITSIVSEQTKIGEDVSGHTTAINQMTDAIQLQAESITDIQGNISSQQASIELNSQNIALKVEQTDIDSAVSDINLDTRNYVLNSDFSRVDDAGNIEDWGNVNEDFYVEVVDGKNFLRINRSGLIANIVASASTNAFPAANGDRLMIGMDFRIEDLMTYDMQTVFVLDLYDINDVRVFYKEYQLSDLGVIMSNGKEKRITTTYSVTRADVAKAKLRLVEYRNGFVGYANISVQKGDIGTGGWSPAPEDSKKIQATMKTAIDQNAQEITLKADSSVVDALSGELTTLQSDFTVANDKITANISKLEGIDGTLSEHSAQISATATAITTKVSAVEVEDILTGKAYATQSEVTQTANSITSTVIDLQGNVSDLSTKVEETMYMWVMWADDLNGSGITADPTGKACMGVAYNKPTIDGSLNPADYTWTWVEGEKGEAGEDSYSVEIVSSQGNIFKNGQIGTTLYAYVKRGAEDITNQINASNFKWTRSSADAASDAIWNSEHAGGVKAIAVTSEDVHIRATFSCEILGL